MCPAGAITAGVDVKRDVMFLKSASVILDATTNNPAYVASFERENSDVELATDLQMMTNLEGDRGSFEVESRTKCTAN